MHRAYVCEKLGCFHPPVEDGSAVGISEQRINARFCHCLFEMTGRCLAPFGAKEEVHRSFGFATLAVERGIGMVEAFMVGGKVSMLGPCC